MRKKNSISILSGGVAAALLLGCGPTQPAPQAIRIRWNHDPQTIDPLALTNQTAIEACNLLNTSLLQFDAAQHTIAPALAEQLPESKLAGDSLLLLTYRLRPQATWDDGRPVLARDVECTLKMMACPGLANEALRSQYRFVEAVRIDAHDPRCFTLVCRGQAPEYAQATGDFFILSEAALDPRGVLRRFPLAALQALPATVSLNSGLQAVVRHYQQLDLSRTAGRWSGCGPYQLVKWAKDRYLTFRRKPNWWARGLHPVPLVLQARPPELDYVIIPDAATASLALRRGDLDVYPQLPAREFERLRASPKAQQQLQFYTTPSYDVVFAGFNTRRPSLANALTRQALSRCFDAAGLLRATQLGSGQRTVGIISPADHLNYNDSLALLPFDPAGAAVLLRRAGWQRARTGAMGWFRASAAGPRQQLRLALCYRADESLFTTAALQFQSAAASLGVPVVLQPAEAGAFSQALRTGEFDLFIRILRGNPLMFNFTPILHSAGRDAGNSTGFGTPASDQLIEAIAAADSKQKRARLLRQFQALLQEQVPIVPLFFLPNRVAASRSVSGLYVNSMKPGYLATSIERTAVPAP